MLQNPPEMRPIRQVQSQPLLQRHQERESSFGYLALELASVEIAGFLANLHVNARGEQAACSPVEDFSLLRVDASLVFNLISDSGFSNNTAEASNGVKYHNYLPSTKNYK